MNRAIAVTTGLLLFVVSNADGRTCASPAPRTVEAEKDYTLDLSTAAGANEIRVEESMHNDFRDEIGTRTWHAGDRVLAYNHTTVEPHVVYYRAVAFNETTPSFVPCTWTDQVTIVPTPVSRARYRRGVIPVVGSVDAANGSHFRTKLTLINTSRDLIGGKLFFRGFTGVATASIAYRIDSFSYVEFPDISAALGITELGSLDVVPDDDLPGRLPYAITKVYNATSDDGEYGASVPQVAAGDFIGVDARSIFVVVPPLDHARLNLGVRAGDLSPLISVLAWTPPSKVFYGGFPAYQIREGFSQISLQTWLNSADIPVEAGDLVQLNGFSAIPYIAETNNVTNDMTIHTSFANASGASLNVGDFFR